jgi:hypothetical protein
VIPGNLKGIAGADEICQGLATDAKLPGTYVAWLSTKGTNARGRVGAGGWVRTDGRPFAPTLDALANGLNPVVFYPPRLDEKGNDLGNKRILVATGGVTDGTNPGISQCEDYSVPKGDLYVGDASSGSYGWNYTQILKEGCATEMHLYCFRSEGPSGEYLPPKLEGSRRIFVTSRPYLVGKDINGLCQDDAKNAGLLNSANFVAFVAMTGTPATGRIGDTGPWKRLDEVIVARQPADFANGTMLAPVNLFPDGITYASSNVWTGATKPNIRGTTATCGDWTDGSPTGLAGDSRTTATPDWFSPPNTVANVPCSDQTTRLMCVEP